MDWKRLHSVPRLDRPAARSLAHRPGGRPYRPHDRPRASGFASGLRRANGAQRNQATNLSLDPELLERALEVSGLRIKKAAVTLALHEFIARRRHKQLVGLMVILEWDRSFDVKAERSRT